MLESSSAEINSMNASTYAYIPSSNQTARNISRPFVVSRDNKNLDDARSLVRQGRLRDAFQICSSILESDQNNVDAWHMLSKIHLRAGQMDESVLSARRASKLAPGRPDQLIHLGFCMAAAGRTGDALAIGEEASRLDLSTPATLSNLGTLFSTCNDYRRAAEYFERAIQGDGGNSGYWYNLASIQRMLGEIDKAEQSCNRAIALNPNDGQAHYLRSDLATQSPEANHVDELKSLVSANGQSTQNRILGRFALAKELEDIGEYKESFGYLREATASYRKSIKYDVSDDIAVIDQIIDKHTTEALGSTSPGHEADAPVFVVGLPRSGTTLVERIIQTHSQVTSVGERNDFALTISRLAAKALNKKKLSREELVSASLQVDMAELGREYTDRVRTNSADTVRVIDKMPINYLYCGLIRTALPNAKIVALMRDPMDSCYAAYKAFLSGPYSFTYDLDELGRYYLAFRRLMAHWEKTLPDAAYLQVRYESLVSDFETEARRIFDFLDLPWEPEVLEFQKSTTASSTASAVQVRHGIYASSVGKWKNCAEELEPLRRILAQEIDAL